MRTRTVSAGGRGDDGARFGRVDRERFARGRVALPRLPLPFNLLRLLLDLFDGRVDRRLPRDRCAHAVKELLAPRVQGDVGATAVASRV